MRFVLADRRLHHLFIRNHLLRLVFQTVDPAVSDTITELLLLSPENVFGEVRFRAGLAFGVEGFAEDVFLDALALDDHLLLWVDVHGGFEELLVEEWDAGFESPCGSGFVGAQTICEMQVLDSADGLLVEGLLVWGIAEVEISAEDFVGTLAGEDHLHAHGFDLAGEEEHGCAGTDGGDIESLEVEDDIEEGIETFLNGEGEGVVACTKVASDFSCGLAVGGSWKTNGEGVKLGQDGDGVEVVLFVDTSQLVISWRTFLADNTVDGWAAGARKQSLLLGVFLL